MKINFKGREHRYKWTWPASAKQGDENSITLDMRLIPHDVRVLIKDKMLVFSEGAGAEIKTGTIQDMKLEAAIVGWQNIKENDGTDITFARQTMLDVLDLREMAQVRNDILVHIDEINNLGLDTEKK